MHQEKVEGDVRFVVEVLEGTVCDMGEILRERFEAGYAACLPVRYGCGWRTRNKGPGVQSWHQEPAKVVKVRQVREGAPGEKAAPEMNAIIVPYGFHPEYTGPAFDRLRALANEHGTISLEWESGGPFGSILPDNKAIKRMKVTNAQHATLAAIEASIAPF